MKDLLKNNWLVTIVAAAVVAIVFFGLRAGLDSTAILALVGGISIAVGKLFHRMPPPVAALLFILSTETVITGCAGSFEENSGIVRTGASAAVSDRCASLDNEHRITGGIGKGTAVTAGAAGLATIPTKDEPKAQFWLAVGSIGSAAISATTLFISDAAATSWARECAQGPR